MLVAAGNLSVRPRIETRGSRRIERSGRSHAPRRLSLMMNLFTEPTERSKAMGVFGLVAAVAVVLLLPGFGAGMALNSVLLAAMSDVAAKQSGFASGLVNTAFMMGGALGLAMLASLAASRSARLETAADSHLAALTGSCHLAFLTGALVAATRSNDGRAAPAHAEHRRTQRHRIFCPRNRRGLLKPKTTVESPRRKDQS